jgi:beta-lactamase class A
MILAPLVVACTARMDIPTEFPTPEPPPSATPIPALAMKRDAELEQQFAKIAEAAKGKVGVAAVVLETGDAAVLNADQHYPMQSVYKVPIAMAMMDQVRLGQHDLDEVIGVTKEDFVREGQRSPLRDKNRNGGEFTIRELIRLALVESDGTASDVLLRVMGGPSDVQAYLTQIGIRDMKVVNSEKEIGSDWQTQYENWATPMAAVDILRFVCADAEQAGDSRIGEKATGVCGFGNSEELLQMMSESTPGAKRIKGLLPSQGLTGVVAHKTGTGGTQSGITSATNDIGVIDLPSGKHLAIAVFVSDSAADERTREAVIATIAKAAWTGGGAWNQKSDINPRNE